MTTLPSAAPGTRSAPASVTLPVPDEVARLAQDHTVVPLYREFLADTLTPTTVFDRLCAPGETGFLLESVPVGGDHVARHSYVGHRPVPVPASGGDPLTALEPLTAERVAELPGLPSFCGGAVGYLGYEAAGRFERLPTAAGPGPGIEESVFLAVDELAVVDHATRRLLLLTAHRPGRERYEDAVRRLDRLERRLATAPEHARPEVVPLAPRDRQAGPEGWQPSVTRAEFERRVRRAREYIAAGDIFQVVLSQRFSRPLRTEPRALYQHLRAINPSPYLYHLSLGADRHVIGASPELLVKVEGRRAQARPLAGTRPRGGHEDADLALEAELRADAKELAEHVMLVDLGRNDLSRVCRPGTVRVTRLMDVERFSHVMHLSSTVTGDLSPEAGPLDALRATFPAGTLSGAPKIRAMEIIAELEDERRGVYGGVVGYVGFGGPVDLAIGLRTLVVADGVVHVQAGAGVVADSDPATEYEETLHKAGALFAAVRDAEAAR